ncbi:hypothetical protein BG015_010697 [Linnemannia schmuckeri]|uniref:Uncharacterized protein n=1 Tax=Linnemannia schmuckeri TaxID=64567 RepID=A0A9P5VE40_9FUNG|nr:hypothetical protein BG015_010697 [Linnemannia schmuckeri]
MQQEEETPRERFLASQEILSTVEWVDDLQDKRACAEAMALFEMHTVILLTALKDVKAKKFSRFLKDAVLAISRPIKAIRRLKEYIAADLSTEVAQRASEEPDLFVAFEEKISKAVQGLVTLVVDKWPADQGFTLKLSPEQENELNNQHYLLVYLILMVLDQWVATENMNAASTYFEYANPKYKRFSPRGPNQPPAPTENTGATLRHLQCMMDLCTKCHLSIEDLLVWKPTPVFSTGVNDMDDSYDEEAMVEDNYPLSETGITTLTAGMIYAMINPTKLATPFTFPLTLAQEWVFTTAGGLASGFLNNEESQLPMADKALLVLLHAIDRTPLDSFKMEGLDYCSKDSAMDRMGLFQIFQVMVNFAATCSSSSHRFFCFQGLDRLIQACADDVKMVLLEQLVSPKCPFESMRAAAINLVKGVVERAFITLEKARATTQENLKMGKPAVQHALSPFNSPLLLKNFQEYVLRLESKPFQHSPLKNEGAWHDKFDTFMHALNFYLFLLMRDSKDDNLTEVWSTSNLKNTQSEFLEPLTTRVQDLKEDYIQRLAKVEMEQDADFMDGVQQGGAPPIAEGKIRSKNGVVNFDIDMDDEDDYDSDDDDALKGPPKDTALELNQSMMKLELMDELLERIQELTSSAFVEEEDDD